MKWWDCPDWAIAIIVTTDQGDFTAGAIEEYRRRRALENGDCLCDEILEPEKYRHLPHGVAARSLREERIEKLQDEIEELEARIDDLQHDLRVKERKLRDLVARRTDGEVIFAVPPISCQITLI
jgi:hypothetical protein